LSACQFKQGVAGVADIWRAKINGHKKFSSSTVVKESLKCIRKKILFSLFLQEFDNCI
jgi:hypothetical protein